MARFSELNYQDSLEQFKIEEKAGRRIRMGELETSIWLKDNNIHLDEIKKSSIGMPDPRIVIIKEGEYMGFYIYSHKHKSCFRYSVKLEEV